MTKEKKKRKIDIKLKNKIYFKTSEKYYYRNEILQMIIVKANILCLNTKHSCIIITLLLL